MVRRQALAALLTALLAFPAWSHPGIVGTAAASTAAMVRGNSLVAGSTIFSGDTIEVGAGGSAWIALEGGGHLRLAPASQVRLLKTQDQVEFELMRGRVAFRITPNAAKGRLADATISAAGPDPAVGAVTIVEGEGGVVTAEKGVLEVSAAASAKTVRLRAGQGVQIALVAAPPQIGDGRKAKTLSGRRIALLVLLLGGAVVGVAAARNRSDDVLSFTEKRNEVSPFRFP